jgi:hypothetical protein
MQANSLLTTIEELAARSSSDSPTIISLVGVGLTGTVATVDSRSGVFTLRVDGSDRIAHVSIASVQAIVIENPSSLVDPPLSTPLGLLELRRLASSFSTASCVIALGAGLVDQDATPEMRGVVGGLIPKVVSVLTVLSSEPIGAEAIGRLTSVVFDCGSVCQVSESGGELRVVAAPESAPKTNWSLLIEQSL